MYDQVLLDTGYMQLTDALLSQARLSPESTVIDLACGPGTVLARLRQNGIVPAAAFGFDNDPGMIQLARNTLLDSVTLDVASMENFSRLLGETRVSCVVIHNAIHISDNPDAVYRECFQVLSPGGSVIVSSGFTDEAIDGRARQIFIRLILRARALVETSTNSTPARPKDIVLTRQQMLTPALNAGFTEVEFSTHDLKFGMDLAKITIQEPMFVAGALPGIPAADAGYALTTALAEFDEEEFQHIRRYLIMKARKVQPVDEPT